MPINPDNGTLNEIKNLDVVEEINWDDPNLYVIYTRDATWDIQKQVIKTLMKNLYIPISHEFVHGGEIKYKITEYAIPTES